MQPSLPPTPAGLHNSLNGCSLLDDSRDAGDNACMRTGDNLAASWTQSALNTKNIMERVRDRAPAESGDWSRHLLAARQGGLAGKVQSLAPCCTFILFFTFYQLSSVARAQALAHSLARTYTHTQGFCCTTPQQTHKESLLR